MVGGGEGGARAVKVDHSTFLRIFFEDVISDVDLSLNYSISTHFSRKILSLFFVKIAKNKDLIEYYYWNEWLPKWSL